MAKFSFEERVTMQVERLIHGGKTAMNQFFGGGILIQNSAYNKNYAIKRKTYTCECLTRCGWCTRDCDHCKLEGMHLKALKEIEEGKRVRKDNRKLNDIPTYGASKFHDNKGRTIIVMNFY